MALLYCSLMGVSFCPKYSVASISPEGVGLEAVRPQAVGIETANITMQSKNIVFLPIIRFASK